METEIKEILDMIKKSGANWQREWRVSLGEHNGRWVASLLSYDVLEGSYRLVKESVPENTALKAVARLHRAVELLTYVHEGQVEEAAARVARTWEDLQVAVARYGEESRTARDRRSRWRQAVDYQTRVAGLSPDATGATEQP